MLNIDQYPSQERMDNMNIRMINALGYNGVSSAFQTGYGKKYGDGDVDKNSLRLDSAKADAEEPDEEPQVFSE
jgi:hypothetical protein